eukprot:6210050-Pleurochrysis_carterae.AAC.1
MQVVEAVGLARVAPCEAVRAHVEAVNWEGDHRVQFPPRDALRTCTTADAGGRAHGGATPASPLSLFTSLLLVPLSLSLAPVCLATLLNPPTS